MASRRSRRRDVSRPRGPAVRRSSCARVIQSWRLLDRHEVDVVVLRSGGFDGVENPIDHDLLVGPEGVIGATTERIEAKRRHGNNDVRLIAAVEDRAARVAVARATLALAVAYRLEVEACVERAVQVDEV